MSELVVKGLTKKFGGLIAVNDVSFSVKSGEILGLIGPNGAGKTTVFNCLTGFLKADGGSVEFNGRSIYNCSPNAICALGVARTFQVVQVLQGMSALENVMVGAYLRHSRTAASRRRALEALERVGMSRFADMRAVNLTLPAKKRLEVAMCLATDPQVLMLDESMAGLTPTEIHDASSMICELRDAGMALIVVEHVMEAIMPIADRVMVLDSGIKIAEGLPAEIVRDPRVVSAYLGDKYAKRVKC
ncbi:MAG: Lipopolysaccharide export system ATP-binding protein LptB [Firmicutes bacterium ADurb.Bin506]|jgi:branched-chain amino acid transport system ATP-binding protein|nr:MAG: Lipopolysaccharide export system ATP-binding protein LptB [Firmicutes bacterium ADurb.Bin506]